MFFGIVVSTCMTVLVFHSAGENVRCNDADFSCKENIMTQTTARNEVVFENLESSENISSNNQEDIGKPLTLMETTDGEGITSIVESTTDLAVTNLGKMLDTITDFNEEGTQTVSNNDTNLKVGVLRIENDTILEAITEPDRSHNDTARNPGESKTALTDNAGGKTSVEENDNGAHDDDKGFTVTEEPVSYLQQPVSELSEKSEWPMLGLPGIDNDEDISLSSITGALKLLLPQEFAFDETYVDLLSCRDRCGLSFESPCSCHTQCIIYNNCCPDFKVICPSIVREAVAAFSSELLKATVECRGMPPNRALMVTTCPNATVYESSQYKNIEATSSVDNQEGSVEAQIKKVLEKRPCTDMSTGITYIDKLVYDCYATESSVLRYWIPMMSLTTSTIIPHTLEDFKSLLNFSDFTFQPASGIQIQNCPLKILNSCPDDNVSQDLQNKCTQGSIYYLEIHEWETMFDVMLFANIHCLLCNIKERKNKTVDISRKLYGFRSNSKFHILMSVYDSGKVVYRSTLASPTLWSQVDCDTKKDQNPCQTTSCKMRSNAVEDNCLIKMKFVVSLDSNFEDALGAIKEDLVCAAYNNEMIEQPVLHDVEHLKVGLQVFYIQFLSRTRPNYFDKLSNQFLDIIGYHLYNTTRTQLAAEETRENCETEPMDTEIRETQTLPERFMVPETLTSSDRPTSLETTSDGSTLLNTDGQGPTLPKTTSDRSVPRFPEIASNSPALLETTSNRPTPSLANNGRCNQPRGKQVVNQIKAQACVFGNSVIGLDIELNVINKYCIGSNTKFFEVGNFSSESFNIKAPAFNRSRCETVKKNPPPGSTDKRDLNVKTYVKRNSASHIQGCIDTVIFLLISAIINISAW